MIGTVAVTDYGWYLRHSTYPGLDDINFWKPSASRTFNAEPNSPFFFKLKAPHNAVCGFGYFLRYSVLPDWLAWDAFSVANGCDSLAEMRDRIRTIRERIRFQGDLHSPLIGCIIIVQPTFFPPERWVRPPADWRVRTQASKAYDLGSGEGARVLRDCLEVAESLGREGTSTRVSAPAAAYGAPVLVRPRLGQGAFRITVMENYRRSCAVTEEHSLPALEAAHIKPVAASGPYSPDNGLLLRADLHRLFDRGYISVSEDLRLVVSRRLREDFDNGRSYYPLQGRALVLPSAPEDRPAPAHLEWHREHSFLG